MSTTMGIEVCQEAHAHNRAKFIHQQQQSPARGRRFAPLSIPSSQPTTSNNLSSRMRDYLGSTRSTAAARSFASSFRSSSIASNPNAINAANEEEGDTLSHFSDDSGVSTGTTYSEYTRRKRKCAMRMMCVYLCAAGSVFLGVLLWRTGLVFVHVDDDSLSAIRDYSTHNGYDEMGRMLCNGLASNCHRRANEIMYATVHNAMSSRENNFLAYNNLIRLEDALLAGFRGLTIDSCDCARVGIQLCHGLCITGFRRPVETFTAIVEFMKQNPYEVVVLELQIGDESLGPLFSELQEVEGLSDLLYQHPRGLAKWPKLKDMIEMDQRLIVFAHDDVGCEERGECPPGVHATFDYAFSTPFGLRSAGELMNVDGTCTVNRGWSNADFVILNHFATNDQGLPDLNVATVTNAALNLQIRIDACQDKFNYKFGQEVINLLVVDFWNIGDTLDVVHKYNSALPSKTEAPSESPSLAPTLPQPSPTPNVQPTTDTPTHSPTKEATAPSANPTLSLESLFGSLMNDAQPTTTPSAIEVPSNDTTATPPSAIAVPSYEPPSNYTTTIPSAAIEVPSNYTANTTTGATTNTTTNFSMPSLGEAIDILSESAVSTTPPSLVSTTTSPSVGGNTSATRAPSLSPSTPSPTMAETVSSTRSPTLPPSTPSPTMADTVYSTRSPTFGVNKEEEWNFDTDEEVEKEQPLVSSAFARDTVDPTVEDTTAPPTTEEGNDHSHSFFVIEKDPSP